MDKKIEQELLRRALGYEVVEKEERLVEGSLVSIETTRHIPANVLAIALWLHRANPEKWNIAIDEDMLRHYYIESVKDYG